MKAVLFLLVLFSAVHANAQHYEWGKVFAANQSVELFDMAADSEGNSYYLAMFNYSLDVDPGPEEVILTQIGPKDNTCLIKLDQNGVFLWAHQWPFGIDVNNVLSYNASSIAIDADDKIFLLVAYQGNVDFNPGTDELILPSTLVTSAMLQLDVNGNLLNALSFGDGADLNKARMSFDGSNSLVISGSFRGVVDFDLGAGIAPLYAGVDSESVFIAKYDDDLNLFWTKKFVASDYAEVHDHCISNVGEIYLAGSWIGSCDFDPSENAQILISTGTTFNYYLCKISSDGEFLWVQQYNEMPYYTRKADIAINGNNQLALTLACDYNFDFDLSDGESLLNLNSTNGVLLKLDAQGQLTWIASFPVSFGDCAFDGFNNLYLFGSYSSELDVDPGEGVFYLPDPDPANLYLLRLDANGVFDWARPISSVSTMYLSELLVEADGTVYINGLCSDNIVLDANGADFVNLNSMDSDQAIFSIRHEYCDLVEAEVDIEACYEYFLPDGSGALYESGSYTFFDEDIYGCDTIFQINLTIVQLYPYIYMEGNSLVCSIPDAIYQWYNGSNFSQLPGEVNQSFTPGASGFYYVMVTVNSCTFYSNAVNFVGVDEAASNWYSVYPNPVSQELFVTRKFSTAEPYALTDVFGKTFKHGVLKNASESVDTSDLASGIYFLRLQNAVIRIIVQ